jgi:ribosomal protein S18 acetylase RimI-like enzyme
MRDTSPGGRTMESLTIHVEDNPCDRDIHMVLEGLLADHAAKGHPRAPMKLTVFLYDSNNKVLGGLIGSTYWGRLVIEKLWVDEKLRDRGYGERILKAAEKEAIRRGCRYAHTDTFTWQALRFYERLGYEQYAELKDFPKGYSLHYIQKRLIDDTP